MSETKNKDEQAKARSAHLFSLLTYPLSILPILNLPLAALSTALAPLLVWFTNKKEKYVGEQAGEAIFFQIVLAAFFSIFTWSFGGNEASDKFLKYLGYFGVSLFHLVSLLVASISTSYGKDFKHLFSPRRFFSKKRELTEEEEKYLKNELDNVSKKIYIEVMKLCESRTDEVASLSTKILDYKIKSKANAILEQLHKLLDNFRKDPRDLPPSRHFMMYTLDSLVRILTKYVDLQNEAPKNPEIQNILEKVEPTLDAIQTALEKHYAKMLENDIIDLDVDLEVMQKNIEMGGL
ncbi:MAG: 5-bromo-4-chloroindolyl phosphate hydrolysis family protein [Leptospiraceae bacterium]|nr:5-bromo-4-chloroindolyl phosphate hydrolysis family protein [Leptospiraceae bacterium]